MKILITSGATREPVDDVRYLSNLSTGATGAALADALSVRGHVVTLLHGTGAVEPRGVRDRRIFTSAKDLQAQLGRMVAGGGFDAVVHGAAVADYTPARARQGKISSQRNGLTLRLVAVPKILPRIKSFGRGGAKPLVVGFKLTARADRTAREAAVARLMAGGAVDAVVHNDLNDLGNGPDRPFQAYVTGRTRPQVLAGVAALAEWLDEFVSRARCGG
jgi:phosphopantothenoylcysteine decarboxylase/phosphopantothenate--cysteine ligase